MEHHQPDTEYEIGPTYKVLFIGACIIIGSFTGWWLTDLKQLVTGIQNDLKFINSRSAELEARAGQHEIQIERLQRDYYEAISRIHEFEKALIIKK